MAFSLKVRLQSKSGGGDFQEGLIMRQFNLQLLANKKKGVRNTQMDFLLVLLLQCLLQDTKGETCALNLKQIMHFQLRFYLERAYVSVNVAVTVTKF